MKIRCAVEGRQIKSYQAKEGCFYCQGCGKETKASEGCLMRWAEEMRRYCKSCYGKKNKK